MPPDGRVLVHFWGTRGSIPVPMSSAEIRRKLIATLVRGAGRKLDTPEKAAAFLERELDFAVSHTFGGNSSCVQIAAGGGDKGLNLDILIDFNFEIGRARRQPPPTHSLGKHGRRTANEHRSDVTQTAHRDIGRAPFERNRTAGRRPRSFGENNEIAAAAHRCNAVVDQPRSVIVVADIGRGTNG